MPTAVATDLERVVAPAARTRRCHACQEAVSLAAHDMKTPLSVLNGYIELLLTERLGRLSPAQKEVLLQMQTSGDRLQHFLQDSLSLSALKAGSFTPAFRTASVIECIDEIAAFWGPCFRERDIVFEVRHAPGIPQIKFDSHKTQRVLSNLLENALQFTPRGGWVRLSTEVHLWERRTRAESASVERRSNRPLMANSVRITVADSGPGIAPENHEEIFKEYVRLGPARSGGNNTGLGLAIAKSLMKTLRGKIWVESEIGHGSQFHVLLPFKPE